MRKLILVVLMFIMFACTLGQTPPKQSASAPTEANATSAPQPTDTQVAESATTNPSAIQSGPRRPRGIYAVVRVEEYIKQFQKTNSSNLDAQFNSLYQSLLSNPAIAGITLQVQWDTLNPNPPSSANAYDWSSVDDAFTQATAGKTVQLIVTPGFNSPQWVMNQIPSCDGLFQSPAQTPPRNCGKATFIGFTEGGGGVLPLPWNPFYKSAWQTFLMALAARYGSNPAFVSIAVAGPTAASAEMIMPNDNNSTNPQTQFGTAISPTNMWLKLLAFHYSGMAAYQNSDQAFIDEWNSAIDIYGKIFNNVTLVATTGSGLPKLSRTGFTIPTAFNGDCKNPDMDCAAETTILSHFVDSTVAGNDAKATQTSGMEASRVNGLNLGVVSVKLLSQRTAQLKTPSAQILGGAQFNTSFSNDAVAEGCATKDGCANGISPEQAEYSVLNVFFDGTAVASSFGGTTSNAPLNYLQIYAPDIQYATAHINDPAQVIKTDGTSVMMTAQDLLNLANQKLLQIAETSPAP
ncbi:MAG: hypothetical protein WBW94_04075 [Anaerolineales bacterium]